MIRVIIAEDTPILMQAIKFYIEQDKDIEVVGCAENGIEAFELCDRLSPDLVLMSIMMPICDGIEGTKLIKSKHNIKVLMLTLMSDINSVVAALNNGADGYLLKDISPEELIQSIKSTVSGERIIHQNVLNKIKEQFDRYNIEIPSEDREKDYFNVNLTDKERNVIHLIVQGKSNKEIVESLFYRE